jgi:hypothetical protein
MALEKYKGSYWKWTFKDSDYWKYFIVVFGIWGGATIHSWISEGYFDSATLFFGIPSAAIVYMSYRHWREMVEGRTS